ncbi:hypothetical protein F5B21DRAFT_482144 [Xylaria acuta]|nr:hypothetical protein F5B21DRAFT_482144 [Xylaria acuta]
MKCGNRFKTEVEPFITENRKCKLFVFTSLFVSLTCGPCLCFMRLSQDTSAFPPLINALRLEIWSLSPFPFYFPLSLLRVYATM